MASGMTMAGKLTQNGGSLTAVTDIRLMAGCLTQSADAQAGAGSNLAITVAGSAVPKGKNVAGQDITVKAKTLTTGAELSAARHLSLNAEQNAALDSVVVAGQRLLVTGGGDLTQRRALNGTNITLSCRNITQEDGAESSAGGNKIITGGRFDLRNGRLVNSGDVSGADIVLLDVSLNNLQNGLIYADGLLTLIGSTPDNAGDMQAGRLTLTADRLSNSGTLRTLSYADIQLSYALVNPGRGLGYVSLDVTAGGLQNSGTLVADALVLTADVLGISGFVQGMKALTLIARQMDTGGQARPLSAGDVAILADSALISACTIQGCDVTVSAADGLHNGVLLATGMVFFK